MLQVEKNNNTPLPFPQNKWLIFKEEFFELAHGVLWTCHLVAHSAWVLIDLIIITTLGGRGREVVIVLLTTQVCITAVYRHTPSFTHRVGFVSKKVDCLVFGEVQQAEAEGLVPSNGEHVKADLSSNGVLQANVRELLFQCSNKCFPHLVLLWRHIDKDKGCCMGIKCGIKTTFVYGILISWCWSSNA